MYVQNDFKLQGRMADLSNTFIYGKVHNDYKL